MKRIFVLLAAGIIATTGLSATATTSAEAAATPSHAARAATTIKIPKAVNGAKITKHLRTAIAGLPVAAATPGSYQRTKFKLWDDVDHDCRNTRAEVLSSESTKKTTGKCTITTGHWVSYYDNITFTQASKLDIDHLVPLKEVWSSGAKKWATAKREAYANDLTDSRTLVAVSAHANRSKGDRDPSAWMPTDHKCRYITQWTVVKVRWALKVNKAEKSTLTKLAAGCSNTKITTHRAKVVMVANKTSGGGSGGGGGGGLDPRFSTCTEAKAHGYGPYYEGKDPEYNWYEDRDRDGIVCE